MANAKGTSLIDMVKFLRAQREVAEPLTPEHLRHYLDLKINVAQWYPEADMLGLVKVLAQIMPRTEEPPLRYIGRLNAQQHIRSAYAHLFEGAELSVLPLRARTLWSAMHDTGDLRMIIEDGRAQITISGYGHPSAEMCEMVEPYIEELFRAAGLPKVDIRKQGCRLEGAVDCSYVASWDPDQQPD